MEEELITLDTAKLAKEKGFDLVIHYFFEQEYFNEGYIAHGPRRVSRNWNDLNMRDTISRPKQSLLQKWLRDVHNIFIGVDVNYIYKIYKDDELVKEGILYRNYEASLEKGLKSALSLIK